MWLSDVSVLKYGLKCWVETTENSIQQLYAIEFKTDGYTDTDCDTVTICQTITVYDLFLLISAFNAWLWHQHLRHSAWKKILLKLIIQWCSPLGKSWCYVNQKKGLLNEQWNWMQTKTVNYTIMRCYKKDYRYKLLGCCKKKRSTNIVPQSKLSHVNSPSLHFIRHFQAKLG